jgi:hypothetical protein
MRMRVTVSDKGRALLVSLWLTAGSLTRSRGLLPLCSARSGLIVEGRPCDM